MNKKIAEIDTCLYNLSMNHYLDELGESYMLCSSNEPKIDAEILLSSLGMLSYNLQGHGHGFPNYIDRENNGQQVPDAIIYAVPSMFQYDMNKFTDKVFLQAEDSMPYHRIGIEHFRISGWNLKNKKKNDEIRLSSLSLKFENEILRNSKLSYLSLPKQIVEKSETDIFESFTMSYIHHYGQIEKYHDSIISDNIHWGNGGTPPIWFLIELHDTVFEQDGYVVPGIFNCKILETIQNNLDLLTGICWYDCTGFYVCCHEFLKTCSGYNSVPEFVQIQYYKQNEYWWNCTQNKKKLVHQNNRKQGD